MMRTILDTVGMQNKKVVLNNVNNAKPLIIHIKHIYIIKNTI